MYFSLFLYVLIKTSKQNYAFSNLNTENIWSFQADFAQTRLNRHNFINENTELHKKQCYGLVLHNTATSIYHN